MFSYIQLELIVLTAIYGPQTRLYYTIKILILFKLCPVSLFMSIFVCRHVVVKKFQTQKNHLAFAWRLIMQHLLIRLVCQNIFQKICILAHLPTVWVWLVCVCPWCLWCVSVVCAALPLWDVSTVVSHFTCQVCSTGWVRPTPLAGRGRGPCHGASSWWDWGRPCIGPCAQPSEHHAEPPATCSRHILYLEMWHFHLSSFY